MKALVWSVAALAACSSNASVRTTAPQAEVGRTEGRGWHIVLHQFELDAGTATHRYIVYPAMVPPDGSAFVPLPTFAVRDACRSSHGYCVDGVADSRAPNVSWAASCGDTRLHVVLDPTRDQITVGRSRTPADPCAITAGAQTFPARGGRTLTAIPWDQADGGFTPTL